jgi:hypothetical protein
MSTINLNNDDGSVVEFLDPAGVQAAVDAAVAAIPPVEGTPAPVVNPEDVEVNLVLSDGSVKKFVPAA